MRLLAIETSTEACSVAAGHLEHVEQRFEVAPRRHGELLLPSADEVLAGLNWSSAMLDAIVVGHGPGAFTGVRMGLAAAQALALAWQLPLIPVSSLASMAEGVCQAGHEGPVFAALDARMGEVYWQAFEVLGGKLKALSEPALDQPDKVSWPASAAGTVAVCGHGWQTYESIGGVDGRADSDSLILYPEARWSLLHALREELSGQEPEMIEPLYLRNKVALTEAERR
jgi:tRNA threonylcarbamoyladenosine biosynthesis protein TsaB